MIVLKNKLRRLRSFNLDAPYFRERKGDNGKGHPESLTLLSLEKKECPDEVMECEQIQNALRAGTLRVLDSGNKAPSKKKSGK